MKSILWGQGEVDARRAEPEWVWGADGKPLPTSWGPGKRWGKPAKPSRQEFPSLQSYYAKLCALRSV